MRPWRLLDTGFADGAYHMALDAAMARGGWTHVPSLRFFRWRPYCISLGYHQAADEVDLARCRAAGYEVARRPTAGRAILHAEELTYSVVIPAGHPWYDILPLDLYRRISEALVAGLAVLGVAARFAPGERLHQDGRPLRMSCFASAARNEVIVAGRKIVGSAQRRFREGVLQHGSLILQDGHEQLPAFLKGETATVAAERQRLLEHTITLAAAAGRVITFAEAAQAVRRGFAEALDIELAEGAVQPEEQALAEAWRERYSILTIKSLEEKSCESLALS
ncbi:MAG: lipoate--protein ligase family protein [candidate division KSB1 bacterium]|nr:lipoate--protein ligase family protein [candidate division KSB1 bacterium]MDZ7276488.1 lipoate--protein ligase family protein [candidate division KSB1 bacterium]MDZ7286731.1 lipoate--protein ligase family protein [candidate division KSB1 bacterium]MDZ7300258.1 lipoate--protein ligase family protein [candidate division KSB1 bacterium]MDZ7308587.1 lipoate--protein ligase family protein [candidate division KSB1 bacterium]